MTEKTETKLTKGQARVLAYIGECNKAPPKCQSRTLLALQDAGLIVGYRVSAYLTHAGSAALG